MSARLNAIARCKAAYASNNIPWDKQLEKLTVAKLEDTAEYWEKAFRHKDDPAPTPERHGPSTRTLIGGTAGAEVLAHAKAYHGNHRDDT